MGQKSHLQTHSNDRVDVGLSATTPREREGSVVQQSWRKSICSNFYFWQIIEEEFVLFPICVDTFFRESSKT